MADQKKLCVLALGAHPDDCDIKAAGTAVKYARAGHRVVFVSLTNGVTGHHEIGGIELVQRRKREAEAAAAIAGIEYQVLDIPSGELMPDLPTRRRIIQMLREIQPDLVMSHRPNDYHPDHRAAAQLVQDACYLATVPNNVPLTPALLEMPVVVYFHDPFQKPIPFKADIAVSIDDVIEQKLDMMHCHTSQMYEWLPYNNGILNQVPAEEKQRRTWLAQQRSPAIEQVAEESRALLKQHYGDAKGAAVRYAESFEACEYGKKLTQEMVHWLFPFFLKQQGGRKVSGVTSFTVRALLAVIAFCLLSPRSLHASDDASTSATIARYPELQKAADSLTDYFGEQAKKLPEGPNYQFFANLAPPQRYVTAAFRDYPIVLGAPGAQRKARLISNGSAINARGEQKMWHEDGFPVTLFVGDNETTFGLDKAHTTTPHLAEGYLPIAQLAYDHAGTTYTEEAFVPVEDPYAKYAGVMMKLGTQNGTGRVRAVISSMKTPDGAVSLKPGRNYVCDAAGRGLVWFDDTWKWDAQTSSLVSAVSPEKPAYISVFTDPLFITPETVSAESYDQHRASCVAAWKKILARGTQIEVPEPLVNDAWRASVLGDYVLLKGDDMNYSAGNNYEKLYAAEGGDAVRSLMLFGQLEDGKRLVPPVMDYWRNELTYHQAAYALQLLAHAFWLTHDCSYIQQQRPRWSREVQEILNGREKTSGLLPRERYAGDIPSAVYSLNSNANCWRGLRDIAAVLKECGDTSESDHLATAAADFRKVIRDAADKSVVKDYKPPFVPIALFGEEKPHDNLNTDHIGAYYCLMAPYVLGSEVFGPGSDYESWLLETFQQRGGLAMGMVRSHPRMPGYIDGHAVNNLYSLRLTQVQLRRNDVDDVLVSFYGKLGQAVTPGTYYSGEASGILPNDAYGRPFYLPPNSAGNAYLLWMLRYMLVQDWDLNDDGKPETLRLLYATPKAWLRDGAKIKIEKAPTAFGEVSLTAESHLDTGVVTVNYTPPSRPPEKTLLRLRLPNGKIAKSATLNGRPLPMDNSGIADLTGMTSPGKIELSVDAAK